MTSLYALNCPHDVTVHTKLSSRRHFTHLTLLMTSLYTLTVLMTSLYALNFPHDVTVHTKLWVTTHVVWTVSHCSPQHNTAGNCLYVHLWPCGCMISWHVHLWQCCCMISWHVYVRPSQITLWNIYIFITTKNMDLLWAITFILKGHTPNSNLLQNIICTFVKMIQLFIEISLFTLNTITPGEIMELSGLNYWRVFV
jgi:hypothetical protein